MKTFSRNLFVAAIGALSLALATPSAFARANNGKGLGSVMQQPRTGGTGEMFSGTATTCAIVPAETETRPNGFTYGSGYVMHVRVATDQPLMNGPVTVTSYWKVKTKPSGGVTGWYWGESFLVPELVSEQGILEETFRFKAQDAGEISGTFYGTDELEGVVVEFAETFDPAVPQTYCTEYPPCVGTGECVAVAPDSPPPFNVPYVTIFEGVIFGYVPTP